MSGMGAYCTLAWSWHSSACGVLVASRGWRFAHGSRWCGAYCKVRTRAIRRRKASPGLAVFLLVLAALFATLLAAPFRVLCMAVPCQPSSPPRTTSATTSTASTTRSRHGVQRRPPACASCHARPAAASRIRIGHHAARRTPHATAAKARHGVLPGAERAAGWQKNRRFPRTPPASSSMAPSTRSPRWNCSTWGGWCCVTTRSRRGQLGVLPRGGWGGERGGSQRRRRTLSLSHALSLSRSHALSLSFPRSICGLGVQGVGTGHLAGGRLTPPVGAIAVVAARGGAAWQWGAGG